MTTAPPRARTAGLRWAVAGVWATVLAATGYVLAFDPTDRVADPTGPCLWHALFGINGPTCGGTRMVWYLLHADLIQAAQHHLVALAGVPFALYALLAWTARASFGRRWPTLRLSRWTYLGYAAVWLLYATVLRNLPWPPFTWFNIPNLT
jgi:hypothetical protein